MHDMPIEVGQKMGPTTSVSSGSLADDWPTLAALSRRYIDRVLVYTGGNKTRAADVLGIDRRTLNRMFAREKAALQAAANASHDDDDNA